MKMFLKHFSNEGYLLDSNYAKIIFEKQEQYAALSYAENDNKTDHKMYVGGINCSAQNAYAEMIAV